MLQWGIAGFKAFTGKIFWPWPNKREHHPSDRLFVRLIAVYRAVIPAISVLLSVQMMSPSKETSPCLHIVLYPQTCSEFKKKKKEKCLIKVLVWTLVRLFSRVSHLNKSFNISHVICNEYHVSGTTWYSLPDRWGRARVMLTRRKSVLNI